MASALFDELLGLAWTARRKSLESFLMPCAILDGDPGTLVARDGSLVSLVVIEGSRSLMGDEELERFVEIASMRWTGWLATPGHAIHVVFERVGGRRPLERAIGLQKRAARDLGLDLRDVLDERLSHLEGTIAQETAVAALWTRPSVLPPDEAARDRRRFRAFLKHWPAGPALAQCPVLPFNGMAPRHEAMVASFLSACRETGLAVEGVSGEGAARIIRRFVNGEDGHHPDWRPIHAASPSMPRDTGPDTAGALPPPLADQLIVTEPDCDAGSLLIGERRYAALDMLIGPRDVRPFSELIGRISEASLPVRFSLLIEGGGLAGAAIRRLASSFTAFSSSDSRMVRNALKVLGTARDEGRAIVRLRLGVLTWTARSADEAELLRRRGRLQQVIEGWGGLVATPLVGDPLETFAGSVPGFACGATAEPALAPLDDVLALLPFSRPAILATSRVNHLFRSPDGRMLPFSMGDGGDHGLDLVYGIPGQGKSVLMNSLALAFTLHGGRDSLAMNAVIDIGPSSSGLVSLIREALPPERRHEAGFFRLSMTPESAINPFDTQLGSREPLPSERAFLVNLLELMLTPAGAAGLTEGMREIIAPAITHAYLLRDDRSAGSEPRRYSRERDVIVDEALARLASRLSPEPLWWEVVDALCEGGDYAAAGRAQRHAVPVMTDLVSAVRHPAVAALVADATVASTGEPVTAAFTRILASLAHHWPILFHPTAFDIGNARCVAIDLADVAPSGSDEADRQTAAVYLLARHALTRHWWISRDLPGGLTPAMDEWHRTRLREVAETPKRLCLDEFHRVSRAPAVLAQVERDAREARKLNVTMTLASQRVEDFTEALTELANRFWILGAGGKTREVATLRSIFSLTRTTEEAVRHSLGGPGPDGAPALLIASDARGRLEQVVVNAPGPVEIWALSTSPLDVALRERLAARLGAREARLRLARAFPSGSARRRVAEELARRQEAGEPMTQAALLDHLAEAVANDTI
ncbi:MAG: hypothetical protein J4G15_00850 [Alphaproteobacteria bacterium]|nr:hypothetical protein [Alphaproteobacteria bacterium]